MKVRIRCCHPLANVSTINIIVNAHVTAVCTGPINSKSRRVPCQSGISSKMTVQSIPFGWMHVTVPIRFNKRGVMLIWRDPLDCFTRTYDPSLMISKRRRIHLPCKMKLTVYSQIIKSWNTTFYQHAYTF